MSRDAYADVVEASDAKQMQRPQKQVEDGEAALEIPKPPLSYAKRDEDEDAVKVPRLTRWQRTAAFLADKHMKQWCQLLHCFHVEFFLLAVEDVNCGCLLLPFRMRSILMRWLSFLETAASGGLTIALCRN